LKIRQEVSKAPPGMFTNRKALPLASGGGNTRNLVHSAAQKTKDVDI
jgi:hypothetical protein